MEEHNLISEERYQKDVAEMVERLSMYAGPDTRPKAPFCNLTLCGSAQAIADEGGMDKNEIYANSSRYSYTAGSMHPVNMIADQNVTNL